MVAWISENETNWARWLTIKRTRENAANIFSFKLTTWWWQVVCYFSSYLFRFLCLFLTLRWVEVDDGFLFDDLFVNNYFDSQKDKRESEIISRSFYICQKKTKLFIPVGISHVNLKAELQHLTWRLPPLNLLSTKKSSSNAAYTQLSCGIKILTMKPKSNSILYIVSVLSSILYFLNLKAHFGSFLLTFFNWSYFCFIYSFLEPNKLTSGVLFVNKTW